MTAAVAKAGEAIVAFFEGLATGAEAAVNSFWPILIPDDLLDDLFLIPDENGNYPTQIA